MRVRFRRPLQREVMNGLELRVRLFELRGAFRIDQSRQVIFERARGIVGDLAAVSLDIDGPAAAKAAEHIVGARREGDQLLRRRRPDIGPTKPRRRLEGAILVEDDAWRDQHRPGKIILKAVGRVSIRREREHGSGPLRAGE